MALKDKTVRTRSEWIGIAVAALLTLMVTLTVNYRAFSEASKESSESRQLQQRIENVTSDNLALQEQIHYLKNDPNTVEREVKKFGFRRPKEKVSVPTAK